MKKGHFCAINATLANNQRSWFEDKKHAEAEADALLIGDRVYAGYHVPDKLLIVQVVGVVERTTRKRALRKNELPVVKK